MIRVQWNKIPGHELWLVLMEFWAFWLNSKCKKLLIMILLQTFVRKMKKRGKQGQVSISWDVTIEIYILDYTNANPQKSVGSIGTDIHRYWETVDMKLVFEE